MSDTPLVMTAEREARIRTRAYHLWQADGEPAGREIEYWTRAEELIGMADHAGAALAPNPVTQGEPLPGATVEEADIQENYGEFPDRFADRGDRRQAPTTRADMRGEKEGRTRR